MDSAPHPHGALPDMFGSGAWHDHREFVRAVARRMLVDDHAAEDVAQDTLLAALENPPVSDESPRAWLATVARNFSRNALRQRERRELREARSARDEATPSVSEIDDRLRMQAAVIGALRALREPYRSTVWMRWYEDLPPREIARRTNTTIETVKSRLKRGLAELRLALDHEYGDRAEWRRALVPIAFSPRAPSASGVLLTVGIVALGALTWLTARADAPRRNGPALVELPDRNERLGLESNLPGSRRASMVSLPVPAAAAPATPALDLVARSGRVLDARTLEPLSGIQIAAPGRGGALEVTSTDASGSFTLELVQREPALVLRDQDDPTGRTLVVAENWIDSAHGGVNEILHVEVGPTYLLDVVWPAELARNDFRAELVSLESTEPRGSARDTDRQTTFVRGPVEGATDDRPWVRFDAPIRASLVGAGARSTCRLILASRDGAWACEALVSAADGRHPVPIRMSLEPRGSLTGRVVDTHGIPVSGARVQVVSDETQDRFDATTDADGRWTCACLPMGQVRWTVSSPGHVEQTRSAVVSRVPTELAVVVTERATYRVRVELESRTGRHRPAGAARLRSVGSRAISLEATPVVDESTSDVIRSRVEFENVPAGRYEVLPPMGDAFAWSPGRAIVDVPGADAYFSCADDVDTADVKLTAVDAESLELQTRFDAFLLLDRYGLGREEALALEGSATRRETHDGEVTFRGIPRGMRGWWLVEQAGKTSVWGELDDLRAREGARTGTARLERGWRAELWFGTRDESGSGTPVAGVRVVNRSGRTLGTSLPDGTLYLDLAFDPGPIEVAGREWKTMEWEGFTGGKLRRRLDRHHVWLARRE